MGTADLEPEWLTFIFQRSPVMRAIVRGPDHVFVAANPAYRQAAGGREILGHPFREIFPEGRVDVLDEVYATGQDKLLHDFRGDWGRGPGKTAYADVFLQPLPGPHGPAGISILAIDVTQAVRARQELAELSAEQLALLDLVPSGIVVLDRGGAVMKVNRAAQQLLGPGPYEDLSSRAVGGESMRDARIRMYLPMLGREDVVRVDAEPVRASDGSVQAIVAVISELVTEKSNVA